MKSAFWLRLTIFVLGFASLFCWLSVIAWLNLTGFCYSQMRYVSDDEILVKTLYLDWEKNARRIADLNKNLKPTSLIHFVQETPTFGRVNGRSMQYKLLFNVDNLLNTPRRIYRLIGIYEVVSSLAFDSGVGRDRYITWFRAFDRCGETTYATLTDEDNRVADDQWNGRWRRAAATQNKVSFIETQGLEAEDR